MNDIYNTEKKLKAETEIYRQTVKVLKNRGKNNALSRELNNQLNESLKSQELYKRVISLRSRSDTLDVVKTPIVTVSDLLKEQLHLSLNIGKRLKRSLNYSLPLKERIECLYKRRKFKQLSMLLKEIIAKSNYKFLEPLTIPKHPVNKYSESVFMRVIGCEQLNRSFSFESIIAGLPELLKHSITDDVFRTDRHNPNARVRCDLIVNNHVLFTTTSRRPSHHCWNQTFEFLHDFGNVLELHVTWVSPYPSLNALIKKTALHYDQLDFMLAGFSYLTFDEKLDRGFFNRIIELYPSGKLFLEIIIKPKMKRNVTNHNKISQSLSRSLNSLSVASARSKNASRASKGGGHLSNTSTSPLSSNIKLLALLGTGHFGKIILCQDIISQDVYAMKALKKVHIVQNNDYAQVLEEKKILQIITECNHPFLLHLFTCFQNEKYVMFLLDFVEAGDLATLIHQLKFFSSKQTRFYAAIIILCLEFLHHKNIMYRDLKMENLLLDKQGYLKLVDFGLSKTNMKKTDRTSTFCGTVDYMAPEMLLDESYTRTIDWWALGIIVYYMITGQVPFEGDTDEESLKAIITESVNIPPTFNESLSSFILSLLNKNPSVRLGSQAGAKDVKAHSYFQRFDFSQIYSRQMRAPFVPQLEHPLDLSYFDSQFTRKKPTLESAESVDSNTCDESFFDNFCL